MTQIAKTSVGFGIATRWCLEGKAVMSRVFISYSRKDRSLVDRLSDLLHKSGYIVWYDKELKGGDEWWAEIVRQIKDCDDLVFLMSPASMKSKPCSNELARAREFGKRIVPVRLHHDAKIPRSLAFLDDINQISLADGITPEGICELVGALTRISQEENPELATERRLADLQLLRELWPYISSLCMTNLDYGIRYHYIDRGLTDTVNRYLELREKFPDKHFIDRSLEAAFAAFDKVLDEVTWLIALDWFARNVDGRREMISRYKLHAIEDDYNPDREPQWLHEHQQTCDKMQEVLAQHARLVETVKRVLPDFDFPMVIQPDEQNEI